MSNTDALVNRLIELIDKHRAIQNSPHSDAYIVGYLKQVIVGCISDNRVAEDYIKQRVATLEHAIEMGNR